MSLKIAVVSNTSFNIVNFRLGLMRALKKAGHDVVAIAPEDDYSQTILDNDFRFIPLHKMTRSGTNPLRDLFLIAELRKVYGENNIDIALQYTIKPNIYGTLATVFSHTQAICTVTGLGYVFLNKNLSAHIAKVLYKISFFFAKKIIFQNDDDKDLFIEKNLVSASKVLVVAGSGIDTAQFNIHNYSSSNNSYTTFVMIARMLIDKGVYEYIEAAKTIKIHYPNTKFMYVGDIDTSYPSSVAIQDYTSWKEDAIVEFLGHQKDVRPYIAISDCVVLPSYREGLPRVIIEGMAMSKACIVTDVPGCRQTIDENISGYFCKVKDADSLAAVMEKYIVLSKEKREEMSHQARRKAEQVFDITAICNMYLNLINSLKIK